jgi:hypothetical protein
MLINKSKKYDSEDIVTLRLVTGEEVISRYVGETDTTYTVTRPMVLMAGPQGVMLSQMVMTLELNSNVDIQKVHVIVHGHTRDEAKDAYIQATTGIKTVRGNLLNAAGMPGR